MILTTIKTNSIKSNKTGEDLFTWTDTIVNEEDGSKHMTREYTKEFDVQEVVRELRELPPIEQRNYPIDDLHKLNTKIQKLKVKMLFEDIGDFLLGEENT